MAFVTNPPENDAPETIRETFLGAHFAVWQDGKPLVVRITALRGMDWRKKFDSPQDSLPVWTMTLPGNGTTRIRMEYEVQWTGGCDGVSCGLMIRYYARPASLWAGKIAHAHFLLRLPDSSVVARLRDFRATPNNTLQISPPEYRWTEEGVEWTFNDWEPAEDLSLTTDYAASDDAELDQPFWAQCGRDSLPALRAIADQEPRVVRADTCLVPYNSRTHEPDEWYKADVRVLVGVDGRPQSLRLVDCDVEGIEGWRALPSAWKFRFVPAKKAGKPVEAWVTVSVPIRKTIGP